MKHPYKSLPAKAFWRKSVAEPAPADVDPVGEFNVRIGVDTKVATAGSCFAQHIARYLKNSGYNYYVAEAGHPIVPEQIRAKHNYGLFSCRYGNIYTARQLLQLFKRAYGQFLPAEDAWKEAPDHFLDPFRPTTQPGGYISLAELKADRKQHLAAVREMFEKLDVFVFTLGLTECWRTRSDGAVFPICPGVEGGKFDPRRYEFYNQPVEDVIADLTEFRNSLKEVNPQAQIIFTVSPVPLVATAQPGAHVLSATTYSKSVLRVAAETMRLRFDNVHYFPSYEVITGSFNRGAYYAADLRNVVEDGVAHVMRLFLAHATGDGPSEAPAARPQPASQQDEHLAAAQRMIEVECDEVALDRD
ncbi:GSCFA domain-containing protein [Sphingomonas piscis]|uniref:GSCFA domain-containing protein n=1 Tax=Sphingomonas piscis TaxID=2714943 RepID=A0A6G7YMW2_9SPHN|nr:GSCFA domain-containing protein [Sphingomonas piscis]QIK78085.1 GSCFA domain-containing protein [Sphingomonas piscis]